MQDPGKDAKHPVKEGEPSRAGVVKLERLKRKTSRDRVAITDNEKTEESLRRSQEHFWRLYEQAPLGYQSLDAEGRLIEVNQAWLHLLGYPRDDVLGRWFGEFLAPHEVDGFKERFPKFKTIGEVHVDIEMMRRNGTAILVHIDGIAARDAQGRFKQTHCILHDIAKNRRAEAALKESELKFRLVTETIEDVFWMSTPGVQEMIYVSPSCEKIWGQSRESLYRDPKSFLEAVHPEDRARLVNIHANYHALGKSYRCEYRITSSEGRLHWICEWGFPVLYKDGRLRYMTGVCTDITERKKAESAIEQLSRFPNESPYPIFRINREGIVLYANEASGALLKDRDSGQGQCAPSDWCGFVKEAIQSKRIVRIETEYNDRIFALHIFPVEDFGYCNFYGMDITERKKTEAALRISEANLARAQQIAHLGSWDWDVKNETLIWSEELFNIFGIDCVELTYEGIEAMIHPEDRERNRVFVHELLSTADSAYFEFRIIRADGDVRYVFQNAEVLRDEAGKACRIFGIMQDITDRKKAEEQVLKYQSKLKAMASQLSSIQERQRRQLAVEMHDRVTQKLAMVKLGLETTAASFVDIETTKKIKDIAQQVGQTMEDAYSLMLELSNPVLYEIGLKAALDTLLQSDFVKKCGIKCKLVAPRQPLDIETDIRVALYQSARELLANAIKYSNAAQIEVCLDQVEDAVVVTVRDDGVGFDPSNIKPPGRQGGFGLFHIRESIGGLGGEFTIETRPGEGTSASVCIPLSLNVSSA